MWQRLPEDHGGYGALFNRVSCSDSRAAYLPLQCGSYQPPMATEHLKCDSCDQRTEFVLFRARIVIEIILHAKKIYISFKYINMRKMQESTNLSVNYLPVFRHEQPELHFYLVACHRSVDRGRTQRREGRKGRGGPWSTHGFNRFFIHGFTLGLIIQIKHTGFH